MEIGVNIDTSAFHRFADQASAAVQAGMNDSDILLGHENAQIVYLADQRDKFNENSAGGGEWPDLKPSTKRARVYRAGGKLGRGKNKIDVASLPLRILYESGDLYTSLYPNSPSNVFYHTQDAVIVGTEDFKAIYHQQGTRRMPQRQILHPPTAQLLEQMTQPIVAGFRAMIARATGSPTSPSFNVAA
jgi:hypothetical protein